MCYGNKHCFVPGLDFYHSRVIITHDLWHAMRQEDKSGLVDSGTGLGLFLCICVHAGFYVGGSVLRRNDGPFLNQHHENMPI